MHPDVKYLCGIENGNCPMLFNSSKLLMIYAIFRLELNISSEVLLFFSSTVYIVAFLDLGLNPPNPEELNRLLIDHVMKQSGPMMI